MQKFKHLIGYRAFANDEVSLNDQPFLFKPRPTRPPILIGGRAPHALNRALAYGDGWLPMAKNAAQIEADVTHYLNQAKQQAKAGRVTVMTGFADAVTAAAEIDAYTAMGVERVVCAMRYDTYDEFARSVDKHAALLG